MDDCELWRNAVIYYVIIYPYYWLYHLKNIHYKKFRAAIIEIVTKKKNGFSTETSLILNKRYFFNSTVYIYLNLNQTKMSFKIK